MYTYLEYEDADSDLTNDAKDTDDDNDGICDDGKIRELSDYKFIKFNTADNDDDGDGILDIDEDQDGDGLPNWGDYTY